jgi:hypothetical protein
LKPIEDICKPDGRSTFLSYRKPNKDGTYGVSKFLDLEYYYQLAADCELPKSIPENVREIWEVAQHLLIYALFEVSFLEASDLYCSLAVEAALKDYCKEEIQVLRQEKLKTGKKFKEPAFFDVCRIFETKVKTDLTHEELKFLHDWLEVFRTLRNKMAHMKKHAPLWVSYSMLPRSSEFLKYLFDKKLKEYLKFCMKRSEEVNAEMIEMIKQAKENAE